MSLVPVGYDCAKQQADAVDGKKDSAEHFRSRGLRFLMACKKGWTEALLSL